MAQSQAIRLDVEPLRSLAFGSLIGTYMGVGTEIENPVRILRIQNLTDVEILISYDGLTDHEILAPSSFLLLDITANKSREHGYYMAQGTRVYVKTSGAPSEGGVYVSVYYGSIS